LLFLSGLTRQFVFMNEELRDLIDNIRAIANIRGIKAVTLDELYANPVFPNELLEKYFDNEEMLVEKILQDERYKFEEIFEYNDFEGVNAIDILFTVAKEMTRKFHHLSPSVTHIYKELHPVIYQTHIEERINFIFGKIQINLQKGISQGMYRNDISIELVARLYISRLIDLQDPDNFPPEEFSFLTLFDQMFAKFIESIATPEGLAYFKKKKRSTKLK